jgi:sec-independent protein translocase protein TatA
MFKTLGVPELLLILVIIFIFFGVGKLPQVGAQFGKAIRVFKKSQTGEDEK